MDPKTNSPRSLHNYVPSSSKMPTNLLDVQHRLAYAIGFLKGKAYKQILHLLMKETLI